MLLAALTFPWARSRLRGNPLAWLVPFLVPVGRLPRLGLHVRHPLEPDAARLQALIMVSTPALLVTVPVIVAVEVHGCARSRAREDRVALRLVLAGTALGGLRARPARRPVPAAERANRSCLGRSSRCS